MKKIFVSTLVLLIASVALSFANTAAPAPGDAGKSLYAGVASAPTASAGNTLIGKLSTGVYAGWNTTSLAYILTTQHVDGNRAFGSSHDATAIYRNDSYPQDPSGAASVSSGYFGASWTAM